MATWMTKHEIGASYRDALDKRGQITILAQLNATSRAEIKDILNELGYVRTKPKEQKKKILWTEENTQTLLRLYEKCTTHRDIAETIGCSLSAIDNKLKDLREEGVLYAIPKVS